MPIKVEHSAIQEPFTYAEGPHARTGACEKDLQIMFAACRRHFSPSWLPREKMAFSQPTAEGARLAESYTRCLDFLVYLE